MPTGCQHGIGAQFIFIFPIIILRLTISLKGFFIIRHVVVDITYQIIHVCHPAIHIIIGVNGKRLSRCLHYLLQVVSGIKQAIGIHAQRIGVPDAVCPQSFFFQRGALADEGQRTLIVANIDIFLRQDGERIRLHRQPAVDGRKYISQRIQLARLCLIAQFVIATGHPQCGVFPAGIAFGKIQLVEQIHPAEDGDSLTVLTLAVQLHTLVEKLIRPCTLRPCLHGK